MKRLLLSLFTCSLAIALLANVSCTADAPPKADVTKEATKTADVATVNTVCPISGKPADPKITVVYEEITYAFADDASRTKFNADRENSLYQKLGGKGAISAVVDAFYVKVLADARIKDFFADINMEKQHRKQKEFLSAAFGGPIAWTGKDMRKAHSNITLTEAHFNAVAENLVATLNDFKIKQELIDQVVAIALSVKNDVLNRPAGTK